LLGIKLTHDYFSDNHTDVLHKLMKHSAIRPVA